MKPKPRKKDVIVKEENYADMDEREINKRLFPGLAMPNDPHIKVCDCCRYRPVKVVATGISRLTNWTQNKTHDTCLMLASSVTYLIKIKPPLAFVTKTIIN